MSTTMTRPEQTVVERYAKLSGRDFGAEIERSWSAAEQIKNQVTDLVQRDELTSLQGVGIMACVTGQVFGYAAFHGQPTSADLIQALLKNDGGSSSR